MKKEVKDCLKCEKPVCDDCKNEYNQKRREYYRERYKRKKETRK